MANYYLPNDKDEITDSYIEALCFDIEQKLKNVLNNPSDENEYDNAIEALKHADAMLDVLTEGEE